MVKNITFSMNCNEEALFILQIKKVLLQNNYLRCRAHGNSCTSFTGFWRRSPQSVPINKNAQVYMPSVGIVVRRKDDSRVEVMDIWWSPAFNLTVWFANENGCALSWDCIEDLLLVTSRKCLTGTPCLRRLCVNWALIYDKAKLWSTSDIQNAGERD
jgi:hypothetical protein